MSESPTPSPAPRPRVVAAPAPDGHIRSFVLRKGKITEAQQAAYERLIDQWSIPFAQAPIDAAAVFGRQAPLILEIGFGMGETSARIAHARPNDDFIGVEVFQAGVGAMLRRIETESIRNFRIIQYDAVEVLHHMIPPDRLAGVHIYFPDPWHKKRHHKRRLIQAPFVQLLASRLAHGGYVHCATDWEPYAQQMLEVLQAEPQLRNRHEGFAPRPDYRPLTKFEQRGLRLGHGVWDLIFERV